MTGQQLKNAILALAVQGKLVSQDPKDETAAALLERVKVEKARLAKAGKIKKEKTLPPITDEEKPFSIPAGWAWVRLGDIVYNRQQKKPIERFSYIDIGSIDNIHQRLNELETIIEVQKAPSRARKPVKMGDVLYSTVRPYLHNMCIIDREFSYEAIASTGFAAMVCYKGLFNKYLLYYLMSPIFDAYANSADNAKGAVYPAINDKKFYTAVVALPPLAEQKRIVEKIEELLPRVSAYDEAEQKLSRLDAEFPDKLKKSILQQAVQGKLAKQDKNDEPASELLKRIKAEKERLVAEGKIKKEKPLPPIKDEEKPFEIPAGWEWVRISSVCQTIVDCPHSTPKYFSTDTGFVAIDTNCIDAKGKITGWRNVDEKTYDQRIARLMPRVNDIVLTREGSIGRAAILPDNKKICLGQRVMLLRPSKSINTKLLQQFIMSPYSLNRLTAQQKGLGAKHINVSDILELPLPLPPLAEQKRIVKRVEEYFALCDKLKSR